MAQTNLIRTIVVDDEPLAVKLLADYVGRSPGLELVLATTDVLQALHLVQAGAVDLVFLDIQMPDLNGIQFTKIIRQKSMVVFTTAYKEYAAESYEYDAVDYLLKPVTLERFMQTVSKIQARHEKQPAPVPHPGYLFVKTEYRIQRIDLDAIFYIESVRDYVAFHTSNGKILSLESMRNLETLLPSGEFVRIHKSYIINKGKISFLERGKVIINNQYLPIGDTYRERFLAMLKT